MDAVALQHIKKSYTSYSSEIVLTGQTVAAHARWQTARVPCQI